MTSRIDLSEPTNGVRVDLARVLRRGHRILTRRLAFRIGEVAAAASLLTFGTAHAIIKPEPASRPSGLTALAIDAHRIIIRWEVPKTRYSGDTICVVRRGEVRHHVDPPRTAPCVAHTINNEYVDTTVHPASRYTYNAAVQHQRDRGPWSDPLQVTTPPDIDPNLGVPQKLTATATDDGSVALSWLEYDPKATGFDVYRDDVAIATVDVTSYLDTSATPGTRVYTVDAISSSGSHSSRSAPYSIVIPPRPPVEAPKLRPGNTTPTSIQLLWGRASGVPGTVTGYHVYRSEWLVATLSGEAHTYTDSGLQPNTPYHYALRAVLNDGSESLPSMLDAWTAPPIPTPSPPATPQGVHAVGAPECGAILVTWQPVDDAGALARYVVTRDNRWTHDVRPDETSYSDQDLNLVDTHSYTVTAVDIWGQKSQPSTPATAHPRPRALCIADAAQEPSPLVGVLARR